MKKVITNEELQTCMKKAINLICDTVGSTLGPSGNNILLNTSDTAPYITNDGVTIASCIESDDKAINTILEIIKEAALKTNELVGDGTTTTLVLLQSIFNEGIKKINSGKDPIILKQELANATTKVINHLDNMKINPTKKHLNAIAQTSANDKELGSILSEVYIKMKSKYAIRIEESLNEKTYYEIKNGYSIECDSISNLYFQKNDQIILNNTYILILFGYLSDLEQISDIINECILKNRNIVILASDYEERLNQDVLLYYLKHNKNIFLFKLPDYSQIKEAIATDIAILTNTSIKDLSYDSIRFSDLGLANNVVINKEEILIIHNLKDNSRINILKQELLKTNSDYDKEFLATRIAKLSKGIATIYIGALTKTEKKEKIMRAEDALFALEITNKGIVAGGGIPLLKISNIIAEENDGDKIIKTAIQAPFKKIVKNSACDYQAIKNYIYNNDFKYIFNYQTKVYEKIDNTDILDPVEVEKTVLKNATSIAGMLLTTSHLVINETYENNNLNSLTNVI